MVLPMSWAREFADINASAQEVADRLTMTGSKVECWKNAADTIQNVVIGKILSVAPHPDSDHMVVCKVDAGQAEPLQIVTGAPNVEAGSLVPLALDGAVLPGGVHIKTGVLRGVESQGMLCSLAELGLTIHDFPYAVENGLLVLDARDYPDGMPAPGTPAAGALGMDDDVFEFEITPNRPDCLAVRELGREAAATFGVPFQSHTPVVKPGHGDVNELLRVDIENSALCTRYCGAVVENVRVAPSPKWMRDKLRACGVRPINNLVDITNYVMLEYGQPMHCFDYKYVNSGHIHVRNARAGEHIVTLDGTDRALSEEMLVIADDAGPIGVAGVMGGEYSGTYEHTTRVVFESAMFYGPSIRTTAKKLGMQTDASAKYAKGLDPNTCAPALARALELVQLLDAGDVVNGVVDIYPAPRTQNRVPLRPGAINRLLGTQLSRDEMVSILLPLGFELDGETVVCPTLRADVKRDCDLAEEVARYVGYNKMPSTLMRGVAEAQPTARQRFDEKMTRALASFGLWECETFSFYSPKAFDMIHLPEGDALRNAVAISNPLGEDTSIMRTTALPSVLEVVGRNYAARAAECAVFEQAAEYRPSPLAGEVADNDFNDYPALCGKLAAEGKTPSDLLPTETQKLIAAAYGDAWDYLAMKGIVEAMLATAGIEEWSARRNAEGAAYHPGRAADIFVHGEKVATVGEVHPAVCAAYGIKARVVAADLNLDVLFAHRGGTAQYTPLPKHPAVTRDLALVMEAGVPAADVAAAIRTAAGSVLESLALFDVYTGEKVGEGKKSLAYNLVLRAPGRTLTDEEAEATVAKVLGALAAMGVALRS